MHSLFLAQGLAPLLLLVGLSAAAPASSNLDSRAAGSCNTAEDRTCWADGFDINTDYESSTPPGTTVTYDLEVTEKDHWLGPDGVVKRKVMLINNQLPGPTIFANWGDTIVVNVKNSLQTNGTGLHWHGMRQYHNNVQDGVNGITECPIAPGTSKTYTFNATQYGTSWYHSHFGVQYGNGVFGAIQIEGPASAPYDIDLGVFPISDYYYTPADEVALIVKHDLPPHSDNVLFNGTNVNPVDPRHGKYANVTLTPGKQHRLRLINPSVENNFAVTLVGHEMSVIATDFVPVNAYTTDTLFLGIGQRYDVIINASQALDNYWFNVTYDGADNCGASNNLAPAAIFHYAGASGGLPTNPGPAPINAECQDSLAFTPVVARTADLSNFKLSTNNTMSITDNFTNPITWYVDKSAISVNWEVPILQYVLEGNASYPASENCVTMDDQDGTWSFWIIQNGSPTPHPMHLHGHDFLVLGYGYNATFTSADIARLNVVNPTRRDSTMLPNLGWLAIAFRADNPGNWLFHCHIAWHVSSGLSVDFMEQASAQEALISDTDRAAFAETCSDWNAYYPTDPFQRSKVDSGL